MFVLSGTERLYDNDVQAPFKSYEDLAKFMGKLTARKLSEGRVGRGGILEREVSHVP